MTKEKPRFPRQLKYIIGSEACERFSYYGMQSILTIFMVQHLAMRPENAEASFHLFVSASYLLTLFGGYLSDRLIGKYKTILSLSIVYCLGHAALAAWESRAGLFWGLALVAIGAGGIKSCVAAYMGDQFTDKNKTLIKNVYDIFYFSINLGAFSSTLLIPWLLAHHGSHVAFGLPGILMFIATATFWLGRKKYVQIPPARETRTAGFLPIFLHALKHRRRGAPFFASARKKFTDEEVDGAQAAFDVIKVFTLISGFWALWNQYGSSWTLQAHEMNRDFLGMHLEASQISALNPIMVLLLIPFFAYVVYPGIERAFRIKLTPLRKMGAGMFVAASSFFVVGLLQVPLDAGHQISVAWQFFPYLIISVSEVMISIPGLELAYTQAPRSMKSTMMSFWYLTIFLGNVLTAFVAKLNFFKGANYFFFFAALAGCMGLGFIAVAKRYRYKNYVEKLS